MACPDCSDEILSTFQPGRYSLTSIIDIFHNQIYGKTELAAAFQHQKQEFREIRAALSFRERLFGRGKAGGNASWKVLSCIF
jgi:hypothetical protein